MIDWRDCIVPIKHKKKTKPKRPRLYVPNTPTHCEFCANACGHCAWSEKDVQQPIPGWDAVRYDIPFTSDRSKTFLESYVVISCPQFELEPKWSGEYYAIDWEHVRKLAERKGLVYDGTTKK